MRSSKIGFDRALSLITDEASTSGKNIADAKELGVLALGLEQDFARIQRGLFEGLLFDPSSKSPIMATVTREQVALAIEPLNARQTPALRLR